MRENYALTTYPLSLSFQQSIASAVGEPIKFLLLTELREKPLRELWRFLRACQPRQFFLPVEDHNASVLLPILQLIARVAAPKQMVIVHPDLRFQTITLKNVTTAFFKLCKATISVNLFYLFSKRKLNTLLLQPAGNCKVELGRSKRVLYLNTNLWFGVKAGGSVGHIAGVVNALVQKGLKVDYAAVDNSSLLDENVNYLNLPVFKEFGLPAVLNYYFFNKKVHSHLYAQNNLGWDFIYQRMSISNFSGVTLSRQLNIPLVLEYNGSEAWIAKNWAGKREHGAVIKAEEICLRHAHIVVTVSDVLRQELITRGVAPGKIVFYPNCIDPSLFNPARFLQEDNLTLRAKHQIPAEAIVVTFVGTFGQWHGVDVLAKVIKQFIESYPSWLQDHKIHFLLVGDGVRMLEVKRILGDHIHHPDITLTGLVPQREAPAYLAISNILVSPHMANADGSRFFGSPTKLFEYMAMGKPIIASDLDQIGEVLKNSLQMAKLPTQQPAATNTELSVLCEPGNIQQWVDAIKFLVTNPEWRQVLGRNARTEALEKYTWEHHVDAFLRRP